MTDDLLRRIAEALERLSPPPLPAADMSAHPAYFWNGHDVGVVTDFAPLPHHLIMTVDRQADAIMENSRRHALGHAAHDILLWGARGMGKSALVKSAIGALQRDGMAVALVEAAMTDISTLPALFTLLGAVDRPFILFIDDMVFGADDPNARLLRSMMEGGAQARPGNVRLYITSNHRNIVEHGGVAAEEAVNPRDVLDDRLALADRFGMKLGFQYPDQAAYLEMVAAYASHFGLEWDEQDAIAFAHARGGRSGRIAWHYAVELAGRTGRRL